jgi:chromosome segregation ATPase
VRHAFLRCLFVILELTVDEQNRQIIGLEDELQTSEDARLRLEVNIGALKQEIDKQRRQITDIDNERQDTVQHRLKAYELQLEQMQQSKQQIIEQRNKFESDVQVFRQRYDDIQQEKEQCQRTIRRLQVIFTCLKP